MGKKLKKLAALCLTAAFTIGLVGCGGSSKKEDTIVLGYPKNLDNTEGERCEKTRIYKEYMERRFQKIPIILWDERFSTVAANNRLMDAGLSHEKRKDVIDKMAAVFILQGYLDSLRIKNEKEKDEI